ncbi:hypothetical protein [Pontibacter akesuensis]|uniref:SpoIIAA-like n=1 Tax=Pontibacter akesuensis TaxID=388950 RepID=A0A1I7GTZ3_9BACT|nr:hypothetical protein [Pontibacter akesuensis]GHA55158.1 hypothetical protein GCM10007389_03200 [Pontibacter akesuensis]SFU51716.1 hypothetical protein SAMN04487941_1256 [Pontibacter akesuensis]
MVPEAPDYIVIKIKEEDKLLSNVWQRSVTSEEYRAGLSLVKQYLLQHDIHLWLADSRKLANVTFEDQQWLIKKLVPELLTSKLQKIARVMHADVFTYISFEQQMERAYQNHPILAETAQFTSVEAALSWLYLKG